MRISYLGILSSTLFVLAGCLSNTPTRTLSGGANDPVAAAQREALGLGDMATKNAGSLPDLVADSFSGDGSGLTFLDAGNISSGTLANARTTASSANTNNTLVLRDGTGDFAAGTISATLNGNASNITATSNSTLQTLSALSLPGAQVSGNIAGNAANVSGTVAILNGGTGATTAADARAALEVSGNTGTFTRTCTVAPVDGSDDVLLGGTTVETNSCLIVSGSVTFTIANGSASGQRLTLIAAAGSTLTLANVIGDPGPYLAGTANWQPDDNDTIELLWTGSAWVELHRSVN